MDMGAYFLSCLCSAKDTDHRDFGLVLRVLEIKLRRDIGVERSGSCMVVVDAIKSDTERIHEGSVQGGFNGIVVFLFIRVDDKFV